MKTMKLYLCRGNAGSVVTRVLYLLLVILALVLIIVLWPAIVQMLEKRTVTNKSVEIVLPKPEEEFCLHLYQDRNLLSLLDDLQSVASLSHDEIATKLEASIPLTLNHEQLLLALCLIEERKILPFGEELTKIVGRRLEQNKHELLAATLVGWARRTSTVAKPRRWELMLIAGVINDSLPVVERETNIQELLSGNSELATEILFSLYLDGEKSELVRSYLVKQLGLGAGPVTENDLYVAIISYPSLSQNVFFALATRMQAAETELLQSLLPQMLERNRSVAVEIVNQLAERKVFNKYQNEFALVLRNSNTKLSDEERRALIKGALGKLSDADVEVLSREGAEYMFRPLYAACVDTEEAGASLAALDVLVTRSSHSPLLLEVMDIVKVSNWADRERLIRPIGILALLDIASEEEIKEMVVGLTPLFPKGLIFDKIVMTQNDMAIRQVIVTQGMSLGDDRLLRVLNSENVLTRIEVIKALRDRKSLEVIQAIRRLWAKEQTPEVRAAITQYHADLIKEE